VTPVWLRHQGILIGTGLWVVVENDMGCKGLFADKGSVLWI
jgi:hypothetical protein